MNSLVVVGALSGPGRELLQVCCCLRLDLFAFCCLRLQHRPQTPLVLGSALALLYAFVPQAALQVMLPVRKVSAAGQEGRPAVRTCTYSSAYIHVVPVAVICGAEACRTALAERHSVTLPRSRCLKTHGCYLVMNIVWSTAVWTSGSEHCQMALQSMKSLQHRVEFAVHLWSSRQQISESSTSQPGPAHHVESKYSNGWPGLV